MTDIVLINQSSVLTDAQVALVVPALQTLFDRDFEPVWRTGLAFTVGADRAAHPNDWPIYLQDTTNIPGAGGYHLDDTGAPMGYVFVLDAIRANESWTVDLTHEFLEMAGDPDTATMVALPQMPGYACLREVCDAVEADSLGYWIDGVHVTDWCTPAYFYGQNQGGLAPTQYDFKGFLKKPAPALLHGGYLGIRDADGNWGQVANFRENGRRSRRSMRPRGRLSRAAGQGALR